LRVTERGRRLALAAGATALLGGVYGDPAMLALAAAMASALALDAYLLRAKVRGLSAVEVEPPRVDLSLRAGDRREASVKVSGDLNVQVGLVDGWVTVTRVREAGDGKEIALAVSPALSGEYLLEGLKTRVAGRFGFLEDTVDLGLRLRVRAYPRVLPWVIEAVRMLGAAGGGEGGGRRRATAGRGDEYYQTREYEFGDSTRRVDWKATARTHKLMVKEFRDVEGSPHVMCDLRSLGPVTADEVAAAFLSTLLGVTKVSDQVALTIKRGEEVLFSAESLSPVEAVTAALAYVLEADLVRDWDVYELVEPRSAGEILGVLHRIKAQGLAEALRRTRIRQRAEILETLRKSSESVEITYVGNVIYDSGFLIELADEARRKRHRLRVLAPAKPWIDLEDLEEAYVMHESHARILSALARLGASVSLIGPSWPQGPA